MTTEMRDLTQGTDGYCYWWQPCSQIVNGVEYDAEFYIGKDLGGNIVRLNFLGYGHAATAAASIARDAEG